MGRSGRTFAVLLLRARGNRLTDVGRLVPKLRATLRRAAPGELVFLEE